jgi:hypothetical protein
MSESDLARRSVAAVTGVVTDIEAAEDAATAGINTYVHIEPDDVVFGSLPAGPLVLREPGGRLRGRTEWVYGSPEYRVGEEVLVFLTQSADGTLRTTGMSMGKFSVELDDDGLTPARFTIRTVPERLVAAPSEPLAAILTEKPDLQTAMARLAERLSRRPK